jgi:ribonuclease HII
MKLVQGLTRQSELVFTQEHKISLVAGVDEVGRGPLAGPVVACAVIFAPDLSDDDIPEGIADSKKLSPIQRELLCEQILKCAHVSVASIPAHEIDQTNIRLESLKAMKLAVEGLSVTPEFVLVDGRDLPDITLPARAIIKGDATCISIAAASIVAKVVRDRQMKMLAQYYDVYGFERHAGYGTAFHREAIEQHEPCTHHRYSFAPIKGRWTR